MGTLSLAEIITYGGTVALVIIAVLNYRAFLKQVHTAREQTNVAQQLLENAKMQLEYAKKEPELQLLQRSLSETSEHLKLFLDKPHLRPYFYENKAWKENDGVDCNEIKVMAEMLLNVFASACVHAASFPQYPIGGVVEVIKFHFRNSPALRESLSDNFDRFQISGLTLLCLKHDTTEEAEEDLQRLVSTSSSNILEKRRRVHLLNMLREQSAENPFIFAKHSLEEAQVILNNLEKEALNSLK